MKTKLNVPYSKKRMDIPEVTNNNSLSKPNILSKKQSQNATNIIGFPSEK